MAIIVLKKTTDIIIDPVLPCKFEPEKKSTIVMIKS